MSNLIGLIGGAVGIALALGAAWAVFRSAGRRALIDLMEQRIRIQDAEILRLHADLKREREQGELLTDKFVAAIVAAVVKGVNR